MWRRIRLVLVTSVVLVAGLVAVPTTAQAASPESTASGHTHDALAANCNVGGLTDRVDGKNQVYGAGWVTCSSIPVSRYLVITVTLFRSGTRVDANANVCSPGVSSCGVSVAVNDAWPGVQTWQSRVRVQEYHNALYYTNRLSH